MLDDFVVYLRSHAWALDAYMALVLASMVAPMLWLGIYYRRRLAEMRGGEALSQAQARLQPRAGARSPMRAVSDPGGVADLAHAIEDGVFGQDVRALQRLAYVVTAAWLVLNVVVIGVPLYAVAQFNERHPDWQPPEAPDADW